MTYKVVRDKDIDDLVKKVNANIQAGFVPIGGICDCLTGTTNMGTGLTHTYSQAMIFEGKENE